jgi:peptide/histidine transporter 3/4
VLERTAFNAIASNLITYLSSQLYEGTATSVVNVHSWLGASYILPLAGGFIADSYWGRFWTMINFSCLYLLVSYKLFTYTCM